MTWKKGNAPSVWHAGGSVHRRNATRVDLLKNARFSRVMAHVPFTAKVTAFTRPHVVLASSPIWRKRFPCNPLSESTAPARSGVGFPDP